MLAKSINFKMTTKFKFFQIFCPQFLIDHCKLQNFKEIDWK